MKKKQNQEPATLWLSCSTVVKEKKDLSLQEEILFATTVVVCLHTEQIEDHCFMDVFLLGGNGLLICKIVVDCL